MRKYVTPQDVVDLLNELLSCDHAAVQALVRSRVPCNERIHAHPTVTTDGEVVGLIGILNGLFGFDGVANRGPIAFAYDDGDGEASDIIDFRLTDVGEDVMRRDGNSRYGICRKCWTVISSIHDVYPCLHCGSDVEIRTTHDVVIAELLDEIRTLTRNAGDDPKDDQTDS